MLTRINTGYFDYRFGEHYIKIENSHTKEVKEIKIPGNPKVADIFNDTLTIRTDVDGVMHKIEVQPRSAYSIFLITLIGDDYSNETEEIIKFSKRK